MFDDNKYYWTGKPCRNGHDAPRYRCNGACYECQKRRRAKYRAKPERKHIEASERSVFYFKHRESELEKARKRRLDNPTTAAKLSLSWRERNKQKIANYSKRYVRANKVLKTYHASLYAARKKKAFPLWANPIAILMIYDLAKQITIETGIPHEVDHILPLAGKNICGLHVENNLQILSKTANRQKYNKIVQS